MSNANLDDVKKAFDNLKNCASSGSAYADALKNLFDEAMLNLARSKLSNEEKIALVMDMRKYFAGLITAGEVEHDMIMRLASGIK
jgi:predicted RNase H-like HicB family nuclease